MLVPNDGRILVELIKNKNTGSAIILPETSQGADVGENLQLCKIVHPGLAYTNFQGIEMKPKFKEGQLVGVMQYSLTGIYHDPQAVAEGKATMTEMMKPENKKYIVAAFDVVVSIE